MMLCPCLDCRNVSHQDSNTVFEHLVIKGMDLKYKRKRCWSKHGDQLVNNSTNKSESTEDEAFNLFKAAYYVDEDYAQDFFSLDEPNVQNQEDVFMNKLKDAETPLYPGSSCTKLSTIFALHRIKSKSGMADTYFNELLETIHGLLPKDNVMLKSNQSVKKFLKSFDMGYKKIHACENDCVLFRKDYKNLDNCPKCGASRWKTNKRTKEIKKGVPVKVLRYFPIIPRFRRMFRSVKMAEDVRWHFSNKSTDGKMRHPVDSLAWETINDNWPSFAVDPRNLRLGLATDGFNPFSILSSKYSCWPVMLVNYNLPPMLCMKKENIMLSLLIPGPKQPGNDIDVYLQPLIDDLKKLWDVGVDTYDAFSKSTFNLKALLMWTINDFPAYGNLAGCQVKGKKACPICGKNTQHRWLRFSRKFVYMCHRRLLAPSHRFRSRKAWFDNTMEKRGRIRILTGRDIAGVLKDFPNDFGKKDEKKKRKRNDVEGGGDDEDDISNIDDQEELSRWRKKSIFFDLPYWKVSF